MVLQRVEAEAPIEHGEAGGGEAHQSSGDDHDDAELISVVVDVCHIAAARLLRRRGEEGVGEYADEAGFCKAAKLEEIEKHGHVLTPGRYVGAAAVEDDGEPFEEKMQRLTADLHAQFAESDALEARIKTNLEALGYGE